MIHRGFFVVHTTYWNSKDALKYQNFTIFHKYPFLIMTFSALWSFTKLKHRNRGRISIPHGTPTPSNLYLGDKIKSGEIITLAHVSLVFPTALSPTRTHLTNSWWGCSSSILLLQPEMLTIFHVSITHTTLQSLKNTRLSPHRFWPCHETGLYIKTIQTIPHNLYVSLKSASLHCGLG